MTRDERYNPRPAAVLTQERQQHARVYIFLRSRLRTDDDRWITEVAKSIQDSQKLVKASFKFAPTCADGKLFRKRK